MEDMYRDQKNLTLIREKIAAIRSALFSTTACDGLKYNTCIISALKVDEQGYIWFLINRNGWNAFRGDKVFPATLSFYRKGVSYSLNITGTAEIISHPQIIRLALTGLEQAHHDISSLLMVKLQIGGSVLFDWSVRNRKSSWIKKLFGIVRRLPYLNPEQDLVYKTI